MSGGASAGGGGGQNFGGGDDRHFRGPVAPGQSSNSASPRFFDQAPARPDDGPLEGEDYEAWADSLRRVEAMLDDPAMRNEAAKVLDEARAMRIDFRRNNMPPQASVVEQRILDPLVELRDQVAEQLARMNQENPLSPIDRDPVPREFRQLVRRYYEQLGEGK